MSTTLSRSNHYGTRIIQSGMFEWSWWDGLNRGAGNAAICWDDARALNRKHVTYRFTYWWASFVPSINQKDCRNSANIQVGPPCSVRSWASEIRSADSGHRLGIMAGNFEVSGREFAFTNLPPTRNTKAEEICGFRDLSELVLWLES